MRTFLAAAVLLLVAGCDGSDALAGVEAGAAPVTPEQLADARRAWEASGITDYDLEYAFECFCPRGDLVRVRAGRVVSTAQDRVSEAQTVDDLFDTAEQALADAATRDMYAAEVRLAARGPRVPAVIEYGTTDPSIADGFARIVVRGFEAR